MGRRKSTSTVLVVMSTEEARSDRGYFSAEMAVLLSHEATLGHFVYCRGLGRCIDLACACMRSCACGGWKAQVPSRLEMVPKTAVAMFESTHDMNVMNMSE